jgi:acetoin utilization deacetylase AcuC-like enzyme
MTTRLYTHPACIEHNPGRMHPERPERLTAIMEALAAPKFAGLVRIEAPRGTPELIQLIHPEELVKAALAAVPASGLVDLGDEVLLSPGSGEAALRAVGGVCAAVDAVIAGEAQNAFCAVRPPGHHAEPMQPMGFCLFNNIAIGAEHARRSHGLERVGVVDFDVHHGNGTQAVFERDRDLFFASTHEWPLYPGTGHASERGLGNVVNAPLGPGSGSKEFRAAMSERILPALEAFRPDLIMISAGFDAHADDPLASLRLIEADYAWVTHEICAIAARTAGGRVVSTLEGGYDLAALAASASAHVEALMAH